MIEPHKDQPILRAGAALDQAPAAMILMHGRGAGAEDILGLAEHLDRPDLAYLAPEAADRTWYPYRFTAPLDANQPGLDSALELLTDLIAEVAAAGIPAERLILLGFSQGACLVSEFAAHTGGRFGAIAALSGGVIGPTLEAGRYRGNLAGTPALFGCSDIDPHIPLTRVQETTALYQRLGAAVTERIYPGMGHSVNEDELNWVQAAIDQITIKAA